MTLLTLAITQSTTCKCEAIRPTRVGEEEGEAGHTSFELPSCCMDYQLVKLMLITGKIYESQAEATQRCPLPKGMANVLLHFRLSQQKKKENA